MNITTTKTKKMSKVELILLRKALAILFKLRYKRRHEAICLEKVAGLQLLITPEVFNPNLFGSSVFLLKYLQKQFSEFKGTALDMGCGSGLLGIALAQQGAQILATDINPEAVWLANVNARLNNCQPYYQTRLGSLYRPLIPDEKFDLIVMNPPYYAHIPNNALEHAFMAGPALETLTGMIVGAAKHLKPKGKVLAVLSSTIPLQKTLEAAQNTGLVWQVVAQKRYWAEWHLIYCFQFAAERENKA